MTGMCLGHNRESLFIVNWRSRSVSELSLEDGRLLSSFSHQELQEPIAVAASKKGELVVVDSLSGLLVFDQRGKLIRNLSQKYFNSSTQHSHQIFLLERTLDAVMTSFGKQLASFTIEIAFLTGVLDQENGKKRKKSQVQGHHECLRHEGGGDRGGGHQDPRPRHGGQHHQRVWLEDTAGGVSWPVSGDARMVWR